MEDALALVVLTLLQLCRGEISQPEWFAANLINDTGYTPKPITEIFTSDSTFTSKNPALFTQPTSGPTSRSPIAFPNANDQQTQTQSTPAQSSGIPTQQGPRIMSQVLETGPKTDLPNFLIVFDPRGQVNPNAVLPTSSPPPAVQSTVKETQPTGADTLFTTESTTSIPSTLRTIAPIQAGIPQQMLSTLPPPTWPFGSMFVYPIQVPNVNTDINTTGRPVTVASSSVAPQYVKPQPTKPYLTVRVKAPRGSITNIRLNPSTTMRPTTTRRRKSNRRSNNYDACINSCNGRKEPICSSLVGTYPVNPDKLKGFASMCHMACHNSYKKDLYEKVTDGRCGRLRTRIRPVDKNKLNREELNKAQYTIVHNAPETFVEFSPVKH